MPQESKPFNVVVKRYLLSKFDKLPKFSVRKRETYREY